MTLKRFLAARPHPDTIDDLQALLTQFQTWYNTQRPHRSTGRRTPLQAYTALPKATPTGAHRSEWRSRTDRVDKHGKVTLRYAGQLRHLGIGKAHAGTPRAPTHPRPPRRPPATRTPARSSPRAHHRPHPELPTPEAMIRVSTMTRLTATASPSTHRTHKKVLSRDTLVSDVATQDGGGG
ncbi:transposase [Microbacterium sp. CFH 90308]|uniref:Transposase n=1 Tax=Microbacterium salsuginis TaxID=2722803 RepID=A0ABX1K6V0_9MICO|nr:transposase [Microbacterium sp. CFH 90308]